MTGFDRLPSRDEVLASGIPAGFIAYQRQQAHAARARAIGAFLAAMARAVSRALYDGARGRGATVVGWKRGAA